MKPQHSTPYIEKEDFDKANSIADKVETAMAKFAKDQFPLKTIIERYTDLIWNCREKDWLSSGILLFDVRLIKDDSDSLELYGIPKGFQLRVHFLGTSIEKKNYPSREKRIEFIKTLESLTQIPVLYIGDHGWNMD